MQSDRPVTCSVESVRHCQFGSWYHLFKHITPRSVIIPIADRVVSYLREDGVVLPQGFDLSCSRGQTVEGSGSDWSDDDDDENEAAPTGREFSSLLSEMMSAMEELDGAAFPKLNWSAPIDAAWVNGGSLKCHTPGDVLLLLKSSMFVGHDLNHAFEACEAPLSQLDAEQQQQGEDVGSAPLSSEIHEDHCYTLVLRKWCNLTPSMHFRCFVGSNRILGISQRDCSTCYSYLMEEAPRISQLISEFFEEHITGRFPSSSYVLDVYVDKNGRVWVIDFNPFASVTDSLLFDWQELQQLKERQGSAASSTASTNAVDEGQAMNTAVTRVICSSSSSSSDVTYGYELRMIPSERHVFTDPLGQYRGPTDTQMLLPGGSVDMDEFIKQCKGQAKERSA